MGAQDVAALYCHLRLAAEVMSGWGEPRSRLRHGLYMSVTIVIEALDEERSIARRIERALAALAGRSGKVILPVSDSSDRTIEMPSWALAALLAGGLAMALRCG